MLLGEYPNAVNKHVAPGFDTAPCKLAGQVFNVAAQFAVRGKEHLSPQTELGVRL